MIRPRRGSRTAMFMRVLGRAISVRRARVLAAFASVVVAAAVATAMLDLYADVEAKMRNEFRGYGANLVVVAHDGGALRSDALTRIDRVIGGGTAVPFAYAVARTASGQPVVVAGTDMERVRRLDTWWSVSAWPNAPGHALVGARALSVVSPDGKPFTLTFEGHSVQLTPAGTLRTGVAEESRIYIDLPTFVQWTGVQPSSIEIRAADSTAEVESAAKRIALSLPDAEVRPVRQVVEAETRVLGKTRASLLASTLIITLTAALCVLATLTTSVLERRRDFAIMKALGASERLVSAFFVAEAAVIGIAGAVAGFAIGVGVAAWIGQANFDAAVTPRLSIFPGVLAGSVAVALLAAALPLTLLRRVQPAIMLRGE